MWNFDMNFTKSPDIFMKVGVYTSEFFVNTQIGVTTVNLKKFVNSPGVEFTGERHIIQKRLRFSTKDKSQGMWL